MQGALHAVEGCVGLLWHPAGNVCKPAVDQGVGAGSTQHLATLCNGAHGLQDGQQGWVLVHWLGQGAGTGIRHTSDHAHTHTQASEDNDTLTVFLHRTKSVFTICHQSKQRATIDSLHIWSCAER